MKLSEEKNKLTTILNRLSIIFQWK